MTFLFHTLPWIGLRQGKALAKKRKPGFRNEKNRRIPQETINAMRAEYEALPVTTAHGQRRAGTVKALIEKYGLRYSYAYSLLARGLRDKERG